MHYTTLTNAKYNPDSHYVVVVYWTQYTEGICGINHYVAVHERPNKADADEFLKKWRKEFRQKWPKAKVRTGYGVPNTGGLSVDKVLSGKRMEKAIAKLKKTDYCKYREERLYTLEEDK